VLQLLGKSFDQETNRCSWRLGSVLKETLRCLHAIQVGKPHRKSFGYIAQDILRKKHQVSAHLPRRVAMINVGYCQFGL
jgi:hypothetical protein